MTPSPATRARTEHLPTFAEVDLDRLRHNARQVRGRVPPGCAILGVVKGDGYGHGAVPVSRVLVQEGIDALGVTRLHEAIGLREAGITRPIVIMGGVSELEAEAAVQHDLRPVVFEPGALEALERAAVKLGRTARVHVKVDTGLGRLGFEPARVLEILEDLRRSGAVVVVEGLMTHFADAEGDAEFTREQLARFETLMAGLKRAGLPMPIVHASSSAAMVSVPAARFDMVRCGILFYGFSDFDPSVARDLDLRPILEWKARIIQARPFAAGETIGYGRIFTTKRPSRIAVLSVGYADGLSRFFSNAGTVLLHGRRVPIVGRVSMDLTMIDVTDVPQAQVGDAVVLIGRQGEEVITAQDHADQIGTLVDDVLCGISRRVPRVYSEGG